MNGIRAEFGALFNPNKSIRAGENLFARGSAPLGISPVPFFARLMPHFPARGTRFELDKMVIDPQVSFIVWHATTPTLKVPLGSFATVSWR